MKPIGQRRRKLAPLVEKRITNGKRKKGVCRPGAKENF